MNMAETVFQSAGHLGFVALNSPYDALDLWFSYGYHQQIWMTPAQNGGYEENYQIPYVGGAFYNQNPLPGTKWSFFEEGGYRSALSPGMTIVPSQGQSLPSGTFTLGGAWNLHGLIGVRYLLTPHIALYLSGNYSYWPLPTRPTPSPTVRPPTSSPLPSPPTAGRDRHHDRILEGKAAGS
ncbi:hypothetical protein B1A_13237, partial [mine drainage metagenome]